MSDAKLESIAGKIDTVSEKVSDIGTKLEVHIAKFDAHVENEEEQKVALLRNTEVLQVNTSSLQDHMQRTDLLETYVKKIDERFTPVELEILRKKAVADWWRSNIMLLAKIGGALAALGTIVGLLKLLFNSL